MASGDLDELLLNMRAEEARGSTGGRVERAFWKTVSAKLLQICEAKVGPVDGHDLKQRSLMVVMKKLPGYEKQTPGGFSRWLHRIVKFEALKLHHNNGNHERKRTGEARAILRAMACPETRLSSTLYKVEQLQAVEQAMPRLTKLQRESLLYVDTHALALAFDIAVETARARRRRAVARLIVLLREATTWRVRIPTS
ncbi:hypothetical protein ENSA5_16550 [Enhygromyxa salina]|uniref:RNA polymerase sigma-70 region 2 domain-containing protein n=2 Tax=Enhygromyxa salina TaxID=215803 RepID=A0A2S9YDZ7_9BACT|nr:hypothetical protein ENSA5_16550 [Enhygromyxa salina]